MHILLIILQVIVSFLFLFHGNINRKFLVTFLLFVAVGLYSSPSRFVLAHDHQATSDTNHPCCQPLTSSITPVFEPQLEEKVLVFIPGVEITRQPFLFASRENIRSPPKITS